MVGEGFLTTLKKSLNEGKITQADIDQAVRRILEAKYRLGLFSDPYKYCDLNRPKTEVYNQQNRSVARSIASQSVVLMKNANEVLPLKQTGTVAVIGPLGDNPENMKTPILLLILSFTCLSTFGQMKLNPELQADALIRQMTLDEKIGQLNQYSSDWESTGKITAEGDKETQIRQGKVGSMFVTNHSGIFICCILLWTQFISASSYPHWSYRRIMKDCIALCSIATCDISGR